MEEIKNQIRQIIEKEYKGALEKGLLDSSAITNQIWTLIGNKEEETFADKPEPVYGCYENFDEYEQL